MMLPIPLYLGLLMLVLPFSVAILYGRRKLRHDAMELERNGGVGPAFAPVDPPEPGWLLRRFSASERVFLRRYGSGRRNLAYLLAYMFTVVLCTGLLPSAMVRLGLPGGGPISIWRSYLSAITIGNSAYAIFGLLMGFLAVFDISRTTTATFPRTRPVSRRMLYWQRVFPNLAALLAGFGVAVGISLLLLVILHGPVFRHLYDADALRIVLDRSDIQKIARTLQTSATRIFLSIALTLLLDFSLAVFVLLQPFGKGRAKAIFMGIVLWIYILSSSIFSILSDGAPRFTRYLFLYSRLGTPPPYRYALIPLVLSVAMLLLASVFNERIEP